MTVAHTAGEALESSHVTHVDVAIVGAGTAGLTALREVRERTDSFVLINAGPYGTTCARVGCMPSKALIAAANAYHDRKKLDEFGIRGGSSLRADIPAVLRRVRSLRDRFVSGVLEVTEDLGARNVAGHARLDGATRLMVGERVIQAGQIILAPGSSPIVPKSWRALGDRILTSDTLFDEEDLPNRIGVIGLGPLGVEFAQASARLGIEVHAFDAGRQIAGLSDEKIADAARDALATEFAIHLGVQVELADARGGIEIRWEGGSVVVEIDSHVHFPDVRIEYERPEGDRKVEDIEVVTPHYRGAYATAKGRTGFSAYRISTGLGGRGGRSGRSPNPRIFEEFL